MLGLPESTGFKKQIEKSKLLDMLGITGKERSRFVSQVHSVTMVAAISPETVNLRREGG